MSDIPYPFPLDVSSYTPVCPECDQRIDRQEWVLKRAPAKFVHFGCWESSEREALREGVKP